MENARLIEADAVVIGAGPVGLFQVFQLGLQGIAAHVVDALPHVGGQCAELYADKPIYDIPGVPVCTGRELVALLNRQIAPFSPQLHLSQRVETLQPAPDGGFLLATDAGAALHARTVFIAAGVGAFVPRTLKIDGIERFHGTQVFHHEEPAPTRGRQVVVLGGEDTAVARAIACAEPGPEAAASVTLVHRRDAFQAAPQDLARLQALRDSGRIRVLAAQVTGIEAAAQAGTPEPGRLTGVRLLASDGTEQGLPLDTLLLCLGVSPRLGPVADWGLALERKQVKVDTATFSAGVPGLYAVGDINTYPGKRKLILCGFHEATLAAFAAAEHLAGSPVALQYTTTSTRLKERLGVAGAGTP
ncbi:NAD(P)/FAD-dependent oxidoreductase [Paracidovorax citrulli]|uniref:Ferredoxin--NADP reductase n=1 Tax=Paracidovorax citrulli TaxID=80869 RepID=A0ABY9AIS8_PARCI|nr:NAD(P)/FAD-dependent oxidoreductase [Paracidovorax citrulli]ATG94231.1 NAD(P)/FAD-dependent oxidoreductase [Paracidovorax citrulli]QCX12647.1 Ferredoxin--NADP reductase [Paracidovorax citrulli]UEG44378.1 NAD(P)/FAD-dependent oxidoreductase [Paracidovorax citrulli]UMT83543.1 NAD(P)/FAD-dependent oxidoreductase [Paracidovorax citrulli]UMT88243.1 NAD(P)/FAD-dependent oxidoreductase [Paracidovorax citrulli]